jgi:5-methylcytosine-specific restriction endonuclease McrA
MRIELWILLIAAIVIANIYTEGRFIRQLFKYKKYYQIAGVVLGALFLYYLIRKNPMKTHEILEASNEYIKYMPMDKNSTALIAPILDFTRRRNVYQGGAGYPVAQMPQNTVVPPNNPPNREMTMRERIMNSGKKATKRSVSETKKKFVASRQNWRCGQCNNQLSAWFEVDHKVRLEYGGSNHIDNLVALCRECHGEKTTMENL